MLLFAVSPHAQARKVYRCVQAGTVSLATAPEPGSRCVAKEIDDNAATLPNLWGAMGVFSGTLYERQQDGRTVYGTRKLPGSVKVLAFTVKTPPGEPAHAGLGKVGKPRLDRHAAQFKAAAKATGVDDAWLRAIAHAESGFDAAAQSRQGCAGRDAADAADREGIRRGRSVLVGAVDRRRRAFPEKPGEALQAAT